MSEAKTFEKCFLYKKALCNSYVYLIQKYYSVLSASSIREDLRRTNEELRALKEARMDEIEDLKQIVRSQNEQLERLKVSRDVDLNREPIESDQRVPNTVDGFVQRVRSKVDVLCMDSNSIDKELCEM